MVIVHFCFRLDLQLHSHSQCSIDHTDTRYVTQPGHPFAGGAMSARQRAITPCGWGVKAGMVHVWVAGKTV